MGATYTRQSASAIATGEVIQASHSQDEFEQLVLAFAADSGHSHDGTAAEGGDVTKLLGTAITIGDGTAGTDIAVTFDGESNDGVLTWMEDEDHFKFSDDVVVDSSKRLYLYDEGGEYIYGDGTDLHIVSGADINIPANIGLTFGNDGEKIEGDGTDLTISGNNINLTAVADVNIPSGVGLTFATAEKIESDGTDLTITVGSSGDINIPANIGLTFGDDGEKIEGDGTDLTISGNNINLTAVADVVIPANVGITFGTGEKIEGDSTNLTITSGADINLTATSDINIPTDVGITFGDDGEKIEGDGTNLTISSSAVATVDAGTDIVLDADGGDIFFKDAGTTFGSMTNTSGDLIIKSGTTTAMTMSGANVTFAGTVTIGSAGISEAELEILDGATVTTTELNIIDGDTSASATTVADADRVVFNDAGTMKQVAVTDLAAYFDDEITAMPNLVTTAATTVGALNSGSITSGFGTIDTGSSTITTTGVVTAGGFTIGSAVINEADLEQIDDLTAGTVTASKAVVVDSNKDAASFRNITLTGELDAGSLDVSGNADIDGTLEADAYTVDGTALNEYIADTVGAMVGSNTETGITVTYEDSDNTLDFVVGTLNQDTTGTASKVTVTDSTANTNFPVTFHDESNALLDDTGALRYNPSTGTLLVPNLTVAGTTTQVDTVTMEAANAVIFEGATADAYETTLSIVDPTADRTQYLINQGGYIPVLAASTTTAITSTPAELNILDGVTSTAAELNTIDGDTSATGTTLVDADRVVVNDAGTMKQVALSDFETYFESGLDTLSSVTTVGALNSGSITSGFGTIDTGSSTITTTGVVTAGGFTIGSAAILEAELEILDGANVTTDELNLLDGSAKSTSSITIADTDAFIVIDGTTTKQIPASNIVTYASTTADANAIAFAVALG